jgi:hypothetical protein
LNRKNPRLTTCFDDLAAALRAWAKGLLSTEAAVELLIGHRSWLYRDDFLEIAVEFGRETADGVVLAAVDWKAAVAALVAGGLPCSGGEGRILRLAASIAGGVAVDLGSALSGLDQRSIAEVARAVLHAAGHRGLRVAVEGERW